MSPWLPFQIAFPPRLAKDRRRRPGYCPRPFGALLPHPPEHALRVVVAVVAEETVAAWLRLTRSPQRVPLLLDRRIQAGLTLRQDRPGLRPVDGADVLEAAIDVERAGLPGNGESPALPELPLAQFAGEGSDSALFGGEAAQSHVGERVAVGANDQ